MNKNINRALFAVLSMGALVGCASHERESRVEGITTTVDTPNAAATARTDELQGTITAEMESWDERLSDLRSKALATRARDRFETLNDNIGSMEKKLAQARQNFLDFRIARSDGERDKARGKINENLRDLREKYNGIPAE